MTHANREPLERLRYWQGQALLSRDFRDQDRLDERRRELHNRALHDIPGVVPWHPAPEKKQIGLNVTNRADGKPGFTVSCGVAYDCAGRLLLLQQARNVDPPEVSSLLILQVRRASAASECGCTPSDEGCTKQNVNALENDVELVWRPQASLDPMTGVALARVTVDGESVAMDDGFRHRPARPLARSRLARGETVRANTPWEQWQISVPDGKGGLTKKVVGVQTHIDTSAAGFTAIPNYFATLISPGWDPATAEFAPAFFPHVAEPTVDGFVFRLLMVETARRRYTPLAATARVTETRRIAGDRLQIDVSSATAFRIADAVALLRARGDVAFRIVSAAGATLTLENRLPDTVTDKTTLAVGHAPRIARVTKVTPADPTVLVQADSTLAIRKNDVLVRLTDNAVTVVNSAGAKGLTVQHPFRGWSKDQPVGLAPRSTVVAVKTGHNEPSRTMLTLATKTHNITAPSLVAGLDDQKKPTGAVVDVTDVTDEVLEIKPALSDATLAAIKHVSLVRKDVTIRSVEAKNPGVVVEVDDVGPFAEGDFVAALKDVSGITVIDKVDRARSALSLSDALAIAEGNTLAAADWITATTVDSPSIAGDKSQIIVGRPGAIPMPSFVVRREEDGFSDPVPVKSVSGTTLTVSEPFDGLTGLDTLAVGAFPRIVTAIESLSNGIRIAEAGTLRVGDVLIGLQADPGAVDLAEVVSVEGDVVRLHRSLGPITPNVTQFGVATFTDAVQVVQNPSTTPETVKVDRELDIRDGDFVATLIHYVDNSNPGAITDIQGNTLTLAGPGIASGDGIVPEDWIDGGILGPAALTPFFEPLVRLEATDGLAGGLQQATAYGYDLVSHSFVSRQVWIFLLTDPAAHVYIYPGTADPYRYRPETLALITTFNTDFPAAFATFAQKQQLAVCWIGCQQEFPSPSGCPGLVPVPNCCGSPEG